MRLREPEIVFALLVITLVVLLAGCGGGGPPPDSDRAQQEADAAWRQVAGMAGDDEVGRPALEAAKQGFLRALQYDPWLASANVGYSMCQAALTADTLDTKYGRSRSRMRAAASALKGFPTQTPQALKDAAAIALPSLSSKRPAGQRPIRVPQAADLTIAAAQADIKDTILPILADILTRLDRARRGTNLPFAIRDGGGITVATIDAGDIALFRATVALVAAPMELSVAYNLDPGSFDPGTIADADGSGRIEPDEYCPDPPFFERYKDNAWGQMLADLRIAIDDVRSGADASNHSGAATDPINPNDPETWQDLTQAAVTANQVQPALAGPVNLDGLVVDLTAWESESDAPDDLRSVFPIYVEYPYGPATLPDPTMAGLFPNNIDPDQAAQAVVDLLMSLYELNASLAD